MNSVAPMAPHVPTIDANVRVEWVPVLLLMIAVLQGSAVMLTLAMHFAPGGPAVALVTLVWLLAYVLAGHALLIRHGISWVVWLTRFRLPLLLLIVGALASTLWSVDPGLSAERSIHLGGSTLVAIAIGFTLPLSRILDVTAWLLGALMVISTLVSVFLPALGIENYEGQQVWRGVLASKNNLGFWAAMTVLLFSARVFTEPRLLVRGISLLIVALSLLNVVQSASATSLLAMIVGGLVMLYLHSSRSLSLGLVASTCLGLFVLALSALAFRYINTAELIGRSGDLTGRGELWMQVWNLVADRPLGGFGYGTIWYPTADSLWIQETWLDLTWTSFHAHNGLLQVASELGLPLMILVAVFSLQQLVEVIYSYYRSQPVGALFVLGFCVALLVSNYSEARLLVNRELYWIFFVALPISLMRQIIVVPAGPSRTALLRRLSPTVRNELAIRRHKVRSRAELKKRLLPRNVTDGRAAVQSLEVHNDPAVRESEVPTKLDRRQIKKRQSHRRGGKPDTNFHRRSP